MPTRLMPRGRGELGCEPRIKARIMHKRWGGGPPLCAWQKRHNALIAPTRAEVEGVFATLKRWLGFDGVRYCGLAKKAISSFSRSPTI